MDQFSGFELPKSVAIRFRSLELAAEYCGRTGRGDVLDLARQFEQFVSNDSQGLAVAVSLGSEDIANKPLQPGLE